MPTQDDLLSRVPKYYELLFPCLKALKALGGSGTKDEILDKVCELEGYSDDVQSVKSAFNQRTTALRYRLSWALTYLKRVDAATNSERGVWTLTEKGAALTESDCERIPTEVRKQYSDERKGNAKPPTLSANDTRELDDEDEVSWRDKLLSVLVKIKPDAFERLCQRILRESGFTKVEVTGKSGDGGIDGIGILRVQLVSFTVLFQCKRYQGSVGPSVIRDFRGAMQGRCDKGLVITTGTFSSDARKEATRDGAPAIDLIDGDALCDLLKSLKLGVTVALVEEVTVLPDWFSQL
jgi:restriction system protein